MGVSFVINTYDVSVIMKSNVDEDKVSELTAADKDELSTLMSFFLVESMKSANRADLTRIMANVDNDLGTTDDEDAAVIHFMKGLTLPPHQIVEYASLTFWTGFASTLGMRVNGYRASDLTKSRVVAEAIVASMDKMVIICEEMETQKYPAFSLLELMYRAGHHLAHSIADKCGYERNYA